MAENNFSALVQLIVDKAQARSALQRELKELQREAQLETDVKVNLSDVRQARKEIEKANKEQQQGTRENIKLRAQELAHARMVAKETKVATDLEIANRQREMKLSNQAMSEELANRKRIAQEQKVATQEELASRESIRKLNEQTFKEESSARRQAMAETKLQAQEQRALQSSLNAPEKRINRKLDNDVYSTDIDKLKQKFQDYGLTVEQAETKVKTLRDTLTDMKGLSGDELIKKANEWDNAFEKVKVQLDQTRLAYDQLSEVNKIQHSLDDKSYEVQIAKLKEGFVKLSGDADIAEKQIKDVRDAYQELVNANGNDKILAEEKFLNVLSREQNQLKINQSEAKEYIDTFKLAKLKNDIETWLKNNTAATKEAKDAMKLYLDEINRGNITPFREKEIRSGMGSITNDMRQMNKLGKSTIETFKQGAKSFLEWTTASGAVMEVWNAVRQGVDELKDLDDILTEISKTSDLTEQQLKKLGDNAFESASKYGKSASDYLTGVQEMYRAGFDNASEMAELSVLAQSAGDMETNLANDYLLATNAAYKYKDSIEELNKVLDSQNYITNNAAISMKDIADATTETASVAAQYGVQIDELSALIATATANTRESGSEVGTALKAILINLQDTTSKPVTETFDALGISMTKVVNGAETLKTPIELIHELADAYNSLPEGDVMRANILNEIGQKRHANTLASILSDMEGYRDMLDLYNSTSANDSAFREAQKSAENWSGTWNKVKNTWSDLLQNFANTDVIVGALNVLNDFIGALDKLGTVGTLALGGGLFARIKNVGGLKMQSLICFE